MSGFPKTIDSKLLSHRLRGFGPGDGSLDGLVGALERGVKHVEFDVRLTGDRRFLVHHDPFFFDGTGSPQQISQIESARIAQVSSLANQPFLDQMLKTFADCAESDVLMHIDVKAMGAEGELVSAIQKYDLLENVVIVSWLPSVLKNVAQISADIKLCYSHISLYRFPFLWPIAKTLLRNRAIHTAGKLIAKVAPYHGELIGTLRAHFEGDNTVGCPETERVGFNHGDFVRQIVNPKMLELLGGGSHLVCLPKVLATRDLVEIYRKHSIRVAVFSISTQKQLDSTLKIIDPDIVYIDNADLFPNKIGI